jgi:hypothetical protein
LRVLGITQQITLAGIIAAIHSCSGPPSSSRAQVRWSAARYRHHRCAARRARAARSVRCCGSSLPASCCISRADGSTRSSVCEILRLETAETGGPRVTPATCVTAWDRGPSCPSHSDNARRTTAFSTPPPLHQRFVATRWAGRHPVGVVTRVTRRFAHLAPERSLQSRQLLRQRRRRDNDTP